MEMGQDDKNLLTWRAQRRNAFGKKTRWIQIKNSTELCQNGVLMAMLEREWV